MPLFSVAVFSYFEVINYFSSVHYFACVPVFISFTYIHFAPQKKKRDVTATFLSVTDTYARTPLIDELGHAMRSSN